MGLPGLVSGFWALGALGAPESAAFGRFFGRFGRWGGRGSFSGRLFGGRRGVGALGGGFCAAGALRIVMAMRFWRDFWGGWNMPLPLAVVAVLEGASNLAQAGAVAAWLVSTFPALWDAPKAFVSEMLAEVEQWAAELIVEHAGLGLDKEDPFSDWSLCQAIEKKTGIALRTVTDRDSVQADVEFWGLAQLEEKTGGLKIKDPRDIEQTKKDLFRYVTPFASRESGIPLSDLSDTEKTKTEVLEHVKDVALMHLSEDIDRARGVIASLGVDFDRIVKDIQIKGGVDPVTGMPMVNVGVNMIVLGILSRALIAADKRHRAMLEVCDKQYARREARREAVRRFREKNGHRMVYVPI